MPKGILLVALRAAKTMLAKAVAGESQVPLPAAEPVEMFVGAARPRFAAICSTRPKAPASCSWTRSTPSAKSAAAAIQQQR